VSAFSWKHRTGQDRSPRRGSSASSPRGRSQARSSRTSPRRSGAWPRASCGQAPWSARATTCARRSSSPSMTRWICASWTPSWPPGFTMSAPAPWTRTATAWASPGRLAPGASRRAGSRPTRSRGSRAASGASAASRSCGSRRRAPSWRAVSISRRAMTAPCSPSPTCCSAPPRRRTSTVSGPR